jgi:hypothetical protein
MSEKSTTIRVKESTRKRLSYVQDVLSVPDYDACINALLDNAGYPTWAEVEHLSKESVKAPPRVTA